LKCTFHCKLPIKYDPSDENLPLIKSRFLHCSSGLSREIHLSRCTCPKQEANSTFLRCLFQVKSAKKPLF